MYKIWRLISSSWFMGVLLLALAFAMGFATFIENDFGATTSKAFVYNAWWFELIFVLLGINLISHIYKFDLLKKEKLPILLFHVAFIVMLLGAAITRYFSYEGTLHIREGQSNNILRTEQRFIDLKLSDASGNSLAEDKEFFLATSITSDSYSESFNVNGKEVEIEFEQYIPNATLDLIERRDGAPIISFMYTLGTERQNVYLREGEVTLINGKKYGFNSEKDDLDVDIFLRDEGFYLKSRLGINMMSMMGQAATSYNADTEINFAPMHLYTIDGIQIVPRKLSLHAKLSPVHVPEKQFKTGLNALVFSVKYENQTREYFAWDMDEFHSLDKLSDDLQLSIKYRTHEIELPFQVYLNDFILERYPGSNSPSAFKSDVVLKDKDNQTEIPYLIYMNNILYYQGYRFYQASYDKDERGTVLSVNRDGPGTFVSYFGYFILFLGMLASLAMKKSYFQKISTQYLKERAHKSMGVILLLGMSSGLLAQDNMSLNTIPKKEANKLGEILVQDQKGRTKPVYTLASDILRKLHRSETYNGMSPVQVMVNMYVSPQNWKDEAILKIGNADLQKLIGINGKYAAYSDIIDLTKPNGYKLQARVEEAYAKPAGKRSKLDKDIIKLDEKINITYMLFTGKFFRIFPVENEKHIWETPETAYQFAKAKDDSLFLRNILQLYLQNVNKSPETANKYLSSIRSYQEKFAGYELPSKTKVHLEVVYNKFNILKRLFPFYGLLGFFSIVFLTFNIIKGKTKPGVLLKVIEILIVLGFVAHTVDLGIRWYISGHAPMSNGFESVAFISWVTILAGIIFRNKSVFALSATAVLGSLSLFVAHLSIMDPEITNLVPVLKSYWLTIHVSVITASYGFLGFGAVLGIINMVLYIIANKESKERIEDKIFELTSLSYKTLTVGIYLLTIGTFLGAVWANESWGRYWGWDPKETWALISIIIYAFVLHARFIPGLKSVFSFNSMTIFAFFSILMTYFGVNYYLSGLHSYAAGDPVPIPVFVYVSVVSFFVLVFAAHMRSRLFTQDVKK